MDRKGWEYEWCKRCNRRNPIGFDVTDEVWDSVTKGTGYENRVLCLTCFDEMAQEKNIKYFQDIRELYLVSYTDESGIYRIEENNEN